MNDELFLELSIDEDGEVCCAPDHVALAMECVFPLCAQGKGKRWRFIGTAFFINHFGVFVTAKHVIEEYFAGRCSPGDDALCAVIMTRDNTGLVLPVLHTSRHPIADVAVGRLGLVQHTATGKIEPTLSFPLTLVPGKVGAPAITFAYPQTEVDAQSSPQHFRIAPWFFHGKITQHHPLGRDRIMLPGNVYETSIAIKGGASGGPVYDENGNIFGINSTGIDGTDVSYVSSVGDVLDLVVGGLNLPDGTRRDTMTIRELIALGAIRTA